MKTFEAVSVEANFEVIAVSSLNIINLVPFTLGNFLGVKLMKPLKLTWIRDSGRLVYAANCSRSIRSG